MTPRVVERSTKRAAGPRIDFEIATAQILADFQYNDSARPTSPPCDDNCRSQLSRSCVEECEIPCTAECTDECVVVCEEPHGINEDLCCDLQNACENSDCRYSYLDESCCMGCSSGSYPFPTHHSGLYGESSFEIGQLSQFPQQQLLAGQLGFHQPSPLHTPHLGVGQPSFRPPCFETLGFSHCTLACSVQATNTYEGSPIPSLVPSTAESPWSLQSSLSGPVASHFSPGAQIESENPLNVLADYSTNDLNFLNSPGAIPESEKLHEHQGSADGLQVLDLILGSSTMSQPKLGSGVNDFELASSTDPFSKTDDFDAKYNSGDLSCRWLLNEDDDLKLCGCICKNREELHKHIIESHVKAIKKRGVPANLLAPVCRWHGCESARKKKVFKLQHLKDHIVCHSKLRMRCEMCGKECRDAKVLKLHMNTHRPGQEKPFRCDVEGCNASFGTSALLSSHKRVHTGEKPHKCAWCNYRAADKGNLRRHEEEMHMGKKWPCPYCSQQLAKKANLTRHIRDLHASEVQEGALQSSIGPV